MISKLESQQKKRLGLNSFQMLEIIPASAEDWWPGLGERTRAAEEDSTPLIVAVCRGSAAVKPNRSVDAFVADDRRIDAGGSWKEIGFSSSALERSMPERMEPRRSRFFISGGTSGGKASSLRLSVNVGGIGNVSEPPANNFINAKLRTKSRLESSGTLL